MSPRISVIIPCYNQGHFLKDALQGLEEFNSTLIEVIIINDGSTDESTIKVCRQLEADGYYVIFQENQGLAAARNRGLASARGEFILPLDSDNKIRAAYLTEALQIMDRDPQVAVVYANAEYFGMRTGIWRPGPFNMQRLMLSNYIDACAVIRKSVLDKIGYYDTGMKYMGWEDWDLWLRIAFAGCQFGFIDKTLWDYRVREDAMSKEVYSNYEKPNTLEQYVNAKYPHHMGGEYVTAFFVKRFTVNPFLFIVKLVIRSYFPGYYNKLLKKNKIRNGI